MNEVTSITSRRNSWILICSLEAAQINKLIRKPQLHGWTKRSYSMLCKCIFGIIALSRVISKHINHFYCFSIWEINETYWVLVSGGMWDVLNQWKTTLEIERQSNLTSGARFLFIQNIIFQIQQNSKYIYLGPCTRKTMRFYNRKGISRKGLPGPHLLRSQGNRMMQRVLLADSRGGLKTLGRDAEIPSRQLTYPPLIRHIWVDDFPFPRVGYDSFLEGMTFIGSI